MSYLDAFLDEDATWGWQGGPEFSTRIVDMANWQERRNAQWAQARHRFEVPFSNVDAEVYRRIKRMHLVCRGKLHAFGFVDQLDHTATDEDFGAGDGATTVFQLAKISVIDTVPYVRNCHLILSAAVKVNGVATPVALDARRGKVTFDAAPANGAVLTWSGEFALWVRFDNDYLPFTLDNIDAHNGNVSLIELPPPGAGE